MEKKHTTYMYCTNPRCSHLNTTHEPDSYFNVYSIESDEQSAPKACPYCKTPMRSSCPHCHHTLQTKPSNFCPLCGGALNTAPDEAIYCRVCGRRMYGETPGDIPLCSENCVSAFITNNIKTCDQCGMRFNSAAKETRSFTKVPAGGGIDETYDFCSEHCMESFFSLLTKAS
ncbi:hypothetical protein GO013_06485 [Pseudodesulfovibrio sp. JC047]|uniref:hypothetical protein n=1 Tax=Pseudodesulfovibrio sp. JC047 TaxID=2683199 RepID=UPI0013D8306F|nr:hypothetical protein [Pseudodesulfovibrio sp. JC047]NDV19066.1 hypothetical protein [Pseudodesulfovibrio sp. JC047]